MGEVRAGTKIQVEGGRQLRASLKAAGDDLSEMRQAHKDAAQIVATASAALAPVRSGKLRKTIRAGASKTAAIVRAGNNRSTASGVPYAGPIHWGWFKRGIFPNPFISDGATTSEGRWIPRYQDYVDKHTEKIKGK